ncbi:hypothetical protein BGZ96_004804 [Linnemannia gamsii]|uniref:Uncharacterized protein n=1 Tax=Linnemannia gamsii TaxID=64522 RepID=A0ABQ7JHS8_9FUNG|nr:hypothetical protein BGZ96_004804 [Linnemannia gamsii]
MAKPKEKNVKAQMQEYLSVQDKAEKMAKDLEGKLQNSDLTTLLTTTPTTSDTNKKRRHEDDNYSTDDRNNKRKSTKNRTNTNSSKLASNDSATTSSSSRSPAPNTSTTITARRTPNVSLEESFEDDQALRNIFRNQDHQMDVTDQDQ